MIILRADAKMSVSIKKTVFMPIGWRTAADDRVSETDMGNQAELHEHKCEGCGRGFDTRGGLNKHKAKRGRKMWCTDPIIRGEWDYTVVVDKTERQQETYYRFCRTDVHGLEMQDQWVNERHVEELGKVASRALKKFTKASSSGAPASAPAPRSAAMAGKCGGSAGAHCGVECEHCPTWWKSERAAKTHMASYSFKRRNFGAASRTAKAARKTKREESLREREPVTCDGVELEGVLEFAYLGNMLSGDEDPGADIDYRVRKAAGIFKKYRRVLTDPCLPLPMRLKLYKVGVCSCLTYSSASWNFGVKEKQKVNGINAKVAGTDLWDFDRDGGD